MKLSSCQGVFIAGHNLEGIFESWLLAAGATGIFKRIYSIASSNAVSVALSLPALESKGSCRRSRSSFFTTSCAGGAEGYHKGNKPLQCKNHVPALSEVR